MKRCGLLYRHRMECLHNGYAPEVTHTYTASTAFCCSYYYYSYYYCYYYTPVSTPASQILCSLLQISNIPPLLSLLRQARFPYHAIPMRYTQWVVPRLTESGSTARSTALLKGSLKEGRLVAKYCSDIQHLSRRAFFIMVTSLFSNFFLYLTKLKPAYTQPYHDQFFFFCLLHCLFPVAAFSDTRQSLSNC